MKIASTIGALGNMEGTLCAGDENDVDGCYPWSVRLPLAMMAAFLVAATIYVASYRRNEKNTQRHWEEVCKKLARDRDNVKHKILDPPSSSSQETEVGTQQTVRR